MPPTLHADVIEDLQNQIQLLRVSQEKEAVLRAESALRTEAAFKHLGMSNPKTQTLQQSWRRAMEESAVVTLFPPDEGRGQAWETVAMSTWTNASHGNVSLAYCPLGSGSSFSLTCEFNLCLRPDLMMDEMDPDQRRLAGPFLSDLVLASHSQPRVQDHGCPYSPLCLWSSSETRLRHLSGTVSNMAQFEKN